MKTTLFFMVIIMYFLTKRYNEYDFYESFWLDFMVQLLHIFTLGYIFIVIVSINEPWLALLCAYVLHKNLNWFSGLTNDDLKYEEDDDEKEKDKDNDNNNDDIENNNVQQ